MNNKIKIIIGFMILFSIFSSSYAQPPFLQEADSDLEIFFPKIFHYPQNAEIYLHFHVVNSTLSIMTNETTDCFIHVYDNLGAHIVEDNLSFSENGIDFEIDFNQTQRIGEYGYIVQCENDEDERGIVSTQFFVTKSGKDESINSGTLLTTIPFLLFFMILWFISTVFFFSKWFTLSDKQEIKQKQISENKSTILLKILSGFFAIVCIGMIIALSTIQVFNGNSATLFVIKPLYAFAIVIALFQIPYTIWWFLVNFLDMSLWRN